MFVKEGHKEVDPGLVGDGPGTTTSRKLCHACTKCLQAQIYVEKAQGRPIAN